MHQHPDAHEIEDLVELPVLDDHLLVDAPQMLRTAGDLRLDAQPTEPLADLLDDLGQVQLALGRAVPHHRVDLGVPLGMQRGEGQVLELLPHVLHAEPVGQGRIDVESLPGDAVLGLHRHRRQGAHVVQPVGQLDDQHPKILGHRHDHLAQRGGLLVLPAGELHPVELRDPVHDECDLRRELPLEVDQCHRGVLQHVVQQGRSDGHGVVGLFGDDQGNRQRVGDVGLPRLAHLPGVKPRRQIPRPADQFALGARLATLEPGDERLDLRGAFVAVAQPGQHPIDRDHRQPPFHRRRGHPVDQ